MDRKNQQILIIEDNEDDVLIIKRGLKKAKIANVLNHVSNGKEAFEYIDKFGADSLQLILLDLNMEIMNGFDFLAKRKESKELMKTPVVVLTSSSRQQDIEKAYLLGANSYVEKPLNPTEFLNAISKIEDFWIFLAKKP